MKSLFFNTWSSAHHSFNLVSTLEESLLLSSCWDTLNIYYGVRNYWIFTMVSANYTVVAVNSLLSVCLAVTFSFSLILFLSLPLPLRLSCSLSPSGPLLWPINRPVGGDGGPLRETEHFAWFPEKGNDRPRQYPALHLLQTPSALLTRLEANTQRT